MTKKKQTISGTGSKPLKVGFVPLADCAPVVMAYELGYFAKHGLKVELSRELGWASVRDKLIHGELDASHALAAMPVAATLGLGSIRSDCLTALVTSLHGNAITLSQDLWRKGVRDGATLRQEIRRHRGAKTFTFGVVYNFSSHRHQLRHWLSTHGIDPDKDVNLVVVPPPQMAKNLKAGHLDGFCCGEPWNSVAVASGAGWIVAASAELDPGHPEKVLMVRGSFAELQREEHLRMVAAVYEACGYCSRPENREQIIATLARPYYVGVPGRVLSAFFEGRLNCGGPGQRDIPDFCVFNRGDSNRPSAEQAAWAFTLVRDSGLCPASILNSFSSVKNSYRSDLFDAATQPRPFHETRAQDDTQPEPNLIPA